MKNKLGFTVFTIILSALILSSVYAILILKNHDKWGDLKANSGLSLVSMFGGEACEPEFCNRSWPSLDGVHSFQAPGGSHAQL